MGPLPTTSVWVGVFSFSPVTGVPGQPPPARILFWSNILANSDCLGERNCIPRGIMASLIKKTKLIYYIMDQSILSSYASSSYWSSSSSSSSCHPPHHLDHGSSESPVTRILLVLINTYKDKYISLIRVSYSYTYYWAVQFFLKNKL